MSSRWQIIWVLGVVPAACGAPGSKGGRADAVVASGAPVDGAMVEADFAKPPDFAPSPDLTPPPDAVPLPRDAAVVPPDAAVLPADAAPQPLDAAPSQVDAAPPPPDGAVEPPDLGRPHAPEGYVAIPPGVFMMGSPDDEMGRGDDEVLHEVTLTRPFFLKATEVTQAEWFVLMGNQPSTWPGCDDCPVTDVTWFAAAAYLNALSSSEGLAPCYPLANCGGADNVEGDFYCNPVDATTAPDCEGYRFPTEAEWEYAARAGTETAFWTGDLMAMDCLDDPQLDPIGWYCGNSHYQLLPVGGRAENPWGLHDMNGSVWEWTNDVHAPYDLGPVQDPTGPVEGYPMALRGGSWFHGAQFARAAQRYRAPDTGAIIGFRPARTAVP